MADDGMRSEKIDVFLILFDLLTTLELSKRFAWVALFNRSNISTHFTSSEHLALKPGSYTSKFLLKDLSEFCDPFILFLK